MFFFNICTRNVLKRIIKPFFLWIFYYSLHECLWLHSFKINFYSVDLQPSWANVSYSSSSQDFLSYISFKCDSKKVFRMQICQRLCSFPFIFIIKFWYWYSGSCWKTPQKKMENNLPELIAGIYITEAACKLHLHFKTSVSILECPLIWTSYAKTYEIMRVIDRKPRIGGLTMHFCQLHKEFIACL